MWNLAEPGPRFRGPKPPRSFIGRNPSFSSCWGKNPRFTKGPLCFCFDSRFPQDLDFAERELRQLQAAEHVGDEDVEALRDAGA